MAACNRCHRRLKDPESLKRGFGRLCAKREGLIADRQRRFGEDVVVRSATALAGQASLFLEIALPSASKREDIAESIGDRHEVTVLCKCGDIVRVKIGASIVRSILKEAEKERPVV